MYTSAMKVAIAGYGAEGAENYVYWSREGHDVTIFDEHETPSTPLPKGASSVLGAEAFSKLDGYDLVVRTAGLAPRKITTDGKVWSATNEFFAKCPAPIIGVTGTKGKGTTCSLIAEILRAAGRTVHLVGNIGVPALGALSDVTQDDIVVFELSSFQLWDLEASPHIAVVLGIEPDHLDVHATMDEYIEAKSHITSRQTKDDILVFKPSNEYSAQISATSLAQTISYGVGGFSHARDGYFYYGDERLCETKVLQIPGNHNMENACAAIAAVWMYVKDDGVIARGLGAFTGLEHRLKKVGMVEHVEFYDDSISTTPGSAIAALNSFDVTHCVLILGGSSKGADFSELAEVVRKKRLKKALLIGAEAPRLAKAFESVGYANFENIQYTSMYDLVSRAYQAVTPQGVVILSPSCASFGLFRNYADRGGQFIQAVKQLEREHSS